MEDITVDVEEDFSKVEKIAMQNRISRKIEENIENNLEEKFENIVQNEAFTE